MNRTGDLEKSLVVANCRMNRGRGLRGINSYERELKFDLLSYAKACHLKTGGFRWLDICCGEGYALKEMLDEFPEPQRAGVDLVGIDLVGRFVVEDRPGMTLLEKSFIRWEQNATFDLITCVHGLHYMGDKLRAIDKALSYLAPGGLFLGNLDMAEFKGPHGENYSSIVGRKFSVSRLKYCRQRRVLRGVWPVRLDFSYDYLGFDDGRGPNYTGQESVDGYYRMR